MTETQTLKRKDYTSEIEPRWCVGCGDYAVLTGMTRALAELGLKRENVVMVSGIGCSSRFPYYIESYGFHSVHGRAPAVATGIKISRPELSVWVITGDGDGLSIGGNHMLHLLRRNPDINVILFNNQIYGLTKGQTSPTSPRGQVTKSTPYGSIDAPIHPLPLAISCGATFAARVPDTDIALMSEVFQAAHNHRGIAFVEVLQNCNIFNDGAWFHVTKKGNRAENTLLLEHGKPLIFGEERNKGLRWRDSKIEVVTLGADGVSESDLLTHDAHNPDSTLAYQLSQLEFPEMPYPLGIFRQVDAPVYESDVHIQEHQVEEKIGHGELYRLFHQGETWQESGHGSN
ncbi:MAG TPA: 2-oxoacid:ferredoxin oxidoreductase subunit beta [candidate division Zixibacteria bacterium]|nr:2-oxoacid:ferredoxin oxidoreductase subunit beta [candidate division Zixibacteria bacterium]